MTFYKFSSSIPRTTTDHQTSAMACKTFLLAALFSLRGLITASPVPPAAEPTCYYYIDATGDSPHISLSFPMSCPAKYTPTIDDYHKRFSPTQSPTIKTSTNTIDNIINIEIISIDDLTPRVPPPPHCFAYTDPGFQQQTTDTKEIPCPMEYTPPFEDSDEPEENTSVPAPKITVDPTRLKCWKQDPMNPYVVPTPVLIPISCPLYETTLEPPYSGPVTLPPRGLADAAVPTPVVDEEIVGERNVASPATVDVHPTAVSIARREVSKAKGECPLTRWVDASIKQGCKPVLCPRVQAFFTRQYEFVMQNTTAQGQLPAGNLYVNRDLQERLGIKGKLPDTFDRFSEEFNSVPRCDQTQVLKRAESVDDVEARKQEEKARQEQEALDYERKIMNWKGMEDDSEDDERREAEEEWEAIIQTRMVMKPTKTMKGAPPSATGY